MKQQDWFITAAGLVEPFMQAVTPENAAEIYQKLSLKMRMSLFQLPADSVEDRQVVQAVFCGALVAVAKRGELSERLWSTAEIVGGTLASYPAAEQTTELTKSVLDMMGAAKIPPQKAVDALHIINSMALTTQHISALAQATRNAVVANPDSLEVLNAAYPILNTLERNVFNTLTHSELLKIYETLVLHHPDGKELKIRLKKTKEREVAVDPFSMMTPSRMGEKALKIKDRYALLDKRKTNDRRKGRQD